MDNIIQLLNTLQKNETIEDMDKNIRRLDKYIQNYDSNKELHRVTKEIEAHEYYITMNYSDVLDDNFRCFILPYDVIISFFDKDDKSDKKICGSVVASLQHEWTKHLDFKFDKNEITKDTMRSLVVNEKNIDYGDCDDPASCEATIYVHLYFNHLHIDKWNELPIDTEFKILQEADNGIFNTCVIEEGKKDEFNIVFNKTKNTRFSLDDEDNIHGKFIMLSDDLLTKSSSVKRKRIE
jgi:hypothetical protein